MGPPDDDDGIRLSKGRWEVRGRTLRRVAARPKQVKFGAQVRWFLEHVGPGLLAQLTPDEIDTVHRELVGMTRGYPEVVVPSSRGLFYQVLDEVDSRAMFLRDRLIKGDLENQRTRRALGARPRSAPPLDGFEVKLTYPLAEAEMSPARLAKLFESVASLVSVAERVPIPQPAPPEESGPGEVLVATAAGDSSAVIEGITVGSIKYGSPYETLLIEHWPELATAAGSSAVLGCAWLAKQGHVSRLIDLVTTLLRPEERGPYFEGRTARSRAVRNAAIADEVEHQIRIEHGEKVLQELRDKTPEDAGIRLILGPNRLRRISETLDEQLADTPNRFIPYDEVGRVAELFSEKQKLVILEEQQHVEVEE